MVKPSKSNLEEGRERAPSHLWFSNLKTEEQRKEFREAIAVASGPVYRRLLQIVQQERQSSADNNINRNHYDSPSWAYIQADQVGYQRALKLVEQLLKDIVK